MKAKILTLVVIFFAITILALSLLPTAYASIDWDDDEDTGMTGSWTWAYISALWPPRYYNFHHDWEFDYAPGYWGPPPAVSTYPGEGGSASSGYTEITIFVYQDGSYIEPVHSEACLPPPD